jgi:hypothetical protein
MQDVKGGVFLTIKLKMLCLLLITVLLSSIMGGCATTEPHYPSVPFAVHRAGETIEQEVQLVHDRFYEFRLRLYHTRECEDAKRVHRLAGSGVYHRDESGKMIPINDGIPVYLELKVIGLDEAINGFYFQKKLLVGEFIGSSVELVNNKPNKDTDKPFFDRIIKEIRLKPGLYRITLKSLRDIPALEGTPVAFKLGWYWNAMPFDK